MKSELLQLIRVLSESYYPVTSAKLANQLDVSPRSVKTYVQEINRIEPDTVFSSRNGYTIDREKAAVMLQNSRSTIPQDSEERVAYIINRIIKSGTVDSYDLCDEMFISYSTLKSSLVKVRRRLSENDLELINQNDMLLVNGLEKNKRRLLSSMMYQESQNNFVNYEAMNEMFSGIDVFFIKETILRKFNDYHYFINDYSLENLILHSAITLDRIRSGYDSTETGDFGGMIQAGEYELARAITAEFEKRFGVRFNEAELADFTMLILSRATNLNYEIVTRENIRSFVGEKIYDLAQEVITDFGSYFYIDLSQHEFFVRFVLHIKNLLVRASSGYYSKNPMTAYIKQNCPLIYDASVNAARIIREKTDIYLNDDEIAYIAFHIGGALEQQSNFINKIKAVLFCPGYYDLNSRISDTLESRFGETMVVSDILTEVADLALVNADIIISTISVKSRSFIPFLVVSPFLNARDLELISRELDRIRMEKRRSKFREMLSVLIREELFTVRNEACNKNELLHSMCEMLKAQDYVGETFEEEVLERDAISSTAIDDFAIPHAMKMHEKKTGMNISICKSGIDWDGRTVRLVMLLCFNRNERHLFNELFEPISMILIDRDNLNNVLQAQSAADFIDKLAALLD